MADPLFSGRIPPELYERVEAYCWETGKAKTDVLVEALSDYLGVERPIATDKLFEATNMQGLKELVESVAKEIVIQQRKLSV
jgi:hypothetical protein